MESYDIIKDFEKLEYTDTAKFCQAAYRNRHIALANIVVDEEGEEESPNIRELAEILESKIKENLYDNEAIQIARKLINEEENFYYEILDSKQKKYEKTVRKLISKYRRTAGALKLIQQCLQLIVIIGAASIPLILSNPDSPRETSTYISIAVAISAALLNIYKFRDRTIFQHKAAEKMQYEYSQFLTD
ncbi:MAG TPA: DUF4231 domain-containing protein, partial [Methylomirabilota bacterium]|nr:DUF4231 domain-containing protein [Methylomirabilota bacterium]